MTSAKDEKAVPTSEEHSSSDQIFAQSDLTLSREEVCKRIRQNIPKELQDRPQWLGWKYAKRDGRLTKVPFTKTDKPASVSNPADWTSIENALAGYEAGNFDGIGFVFTEVDPFFGIDLDNKKGDPAAPLPEWMTQHIAEMNTYAERSPSGTGAHIIGIGTLSKGYNQGRYEAYSKLRFFTVTGDHIHSAPLTVEPRQDALDEFVKKNFKPKNKAVEKSKEPNTFPAITLNAKTDAEVINTMLLSKHGEKINRLLSGIWQDNYESQSHADLALVGYILSETKGDEIQADRIFRATPMFRSKWDEMRGDKTYGQMTIERAKEKLPAILLLEDFNSRFAVVRLSGRVVILHESLDENGHRSVAFLSQADFKLLVASSPPVGDSTAANWWIRNPFRRAYESVVFVPGPCPKDFYNLWQGFSVAPVKGKSNLFWEFVRDCICNGDIDLFNYVRKFLAHMIQKPHELPGVALVLRGQQGTGKNTFVDAIGKLLGQHYVAVNRMDQLTGRFNSHLKYALLVHGNEAAWGGNKSDLGQLKAAITDPKVMIEPKGVDAVAIANYMRLIISSNETWAAPVEIDNRRFLALDVAPKKPNHRQYFDALHLELQNGGHEAIMYDLQNEPLGNWHPRNMPASPNDWDLKLKGASSTVRWMYNLLKEPRTALAAPPGTLITGARIPMWATAAKKTGLIRAPSVEIEKEDFHEIYCHWARRHERHQPESSALFFKEVKDFMEGHIHESRPRNASGNRQRVLNFSDLRACRRQFEKRLGSKIPWSKHEK